MNNQTLVLAMNTLRSHNSRLKFLENNGIDLRDFTDPLTGIIETIIFDYLLPEDEKKREEGIEIFLKWEDSDESAEDLLIKLMTNSSKKP